MDEVDKLLPSLNQLLKPDTTREQFESIASTLLNDKDRQMFGEASQQRIIIGLLYLAPFAPEPATFEEKAYRREVGFDDDGKPIKDEEVTRLLQIAKATGVIKDAPNGKLMVDKQIHPILKSILNQYN